MKTNAAINEECERLLTINPMYLRETERRFMGIKETLHPSPIQDILSVKRVRDCPGMILFYCTAYSRHKKTDNHYFNV